MGLFFLDVETRVAVERGLEFFARSFAERVVKMLIVLLMLVFYFIFSF